MIPIDPLYFLLFLELLLIQAALIGFLYLKWRKLNLSYLKTLKIISELELKQKTFQETERVVQAEPVAPPEVPTPSQEEQPVPPVFDDDNKMLEIGEKNPEITRLNEALEEKVEIILQMKKKIENMEKKFVDMENEYLTLFDQSQKQEQALKDAGLDFDKLGGKDF